MSRVLIVDDEEYVREPLKEILRAQGHEVMAAKNGIEATDCFNMNGFDLTIIDIIMPGKAGVQLIRECLSLNPKIRIVAMTGSIYSEEYLKTARDFGAHAVLSKPFSDESIKAAIKDALAA